MSNDNGSPKEIAKVIRAIGSEIYADGRLKNFCGNALIVLNNGHPGQVQFGPPILSRSFSQSTVEEIPLEKLWRVLARCGYLNLFGYLILELRHSKITDILISVNIKQKDFLTGAWINFFPMSFIERVEKINEKSGENERGQGIDIKEMARCTGNSVETLWKLKYQNPEALPPSCAPDGVRRYLIDPADLPHWIQWNKLRSMGEPVGDSFWEWLKKLQK